MKAKQFDLKLCLIFTFNSLMKTGKYDKAKFGLFRVALKMFLAVH